MGLKPKDIREMSPAEIDNKIISLKESLFKLRSEQKTGRVEKPHHIKAAKRDIARLRTILKERKGAKE